MLGIASEDGWHEFENLFSSPSSSSPRNLVSAPESEQSPLKVNLTKARSQQSNWEHPHTHQQQVNPRFYWSLKSLHPDPLLIHRFWFLILTPMSSFEITYVRAGAEDGSVFDKMLIHVSILCVSNILVWNHLCEGGRRQQKQRLVTSQLTSLKPDTWVDQLLSGQETDNLGGSLPVWKGYKRWVAELGELGTSFVSHKTCTQHWHFGKR